MEKFGLKVGDNLDLKTKYDDKTYRLTISGTYKYPASLAVFTDIENFRNEFEKSDDYFSGYFSDNEITDIDDKYIASKITQKDLTVVSDQMTDSMGGMIPIIVVFSVVLYMLLVYLISKVIIEKECKFRFDSKNTWLSEWRNHKTLYYVNSDCSHSFGNNQLADFVFVYESYIFRNYQEFFRLAYFLH